MNLCRFASRLALAVLGVTTLTQAHASTTTLSGTFTADNTVISDPLTLTSAQNYTFTTTSFASGGIVPVLTLFNTVTGNVVDFSGSNTGFSDVALTDTLSAGNYVLDLTEFPNVAIGNLAAGFLFASNPSITGSDCGVPGGMFYNDITCAQTTANYSVTVTNAATNAAAVTPEPSTLLLVLPPALALLGRRRRTA